MTLAKNANASFSMGYDDDGRLANVWPNATGTGTARTTYTYNNTTARLSSITDNNDITGASITTGFTWNAAGQIQTIDDPFVTGGTNPVTTYGYDTNTGQLTSRTDAQANLAWSRTYEPETGRLSKQITKNNTTQAVLAEFDLGYDAAGNVTSKNASVFNNASNANWSYNYDGASRLTKAIGKDASGSPTQWDYAYDGAGNRTQIKQTNTSTSTVVSNLSTNYDSSGLPSTASDSATGETMTYSFDGAEELTTVDSSSNANDWGYAYDAYGRLTCDHLHFRSHPDAPCL